MEINTELVPEPPTQKKEREIEDVELQNPADDLSPEERAALVDLEELSNAIDSNRFSVSAAEINLQKQRLDAEQTRAQQVETEVQQQQLEQSEMQKTRNQEGLESGMEDNSSSNSAAANSSNNSKEGQEFVKTSAENINELNEVQELSDIADGGFAPLMQQSEGLEEGAEKTIEGKMEGKSRQAGFALTPIQQMLKKNNPDASLDELRDLQAEFTRQTENPSYQMRSLEELRNIQNEGPNSPSLTR
ncbi:hypothetical protein [Neptuniibacter sp. QD37_11]|uniref:hypothetical protein n=1 Tax=Neptuniibacter sp. QD37_11 TaxID=3398209 RepID=UPI0039F541E2